MKLGLTNFSLKMPWLVIAIVLAITAFFTMQFPKVSFDNDPENMLAEDEHIRVFHNQVKAKYSLYDFVIVGIVNNDHKDGIFNVDTLGKIHSLTHELLSLHRTADGLPAVYRKDASGNKTEVTFDLSPEGAWERTLASAFRHDHNRLFDEEGNSCIIGREIISPSVVDNIKQADFGSLKLEYLMEEAPMTREEALTIRNDAMSNPLYSGTLVSEDQKAICIYLPLKAKTYSYNVANLVNRLTEGWGDEAGQVFITGQPVAQDTFGVEMLVQMATSAPLAGLAIFILLLLFFKRVSLIIAPMIVAVVSVLCTMGLLIGLGFDVHIMSSMIAIFLMPIAVADSVHILSEFFDLYHKFNDKAETVRHVINHLFMPMLYTTLTTIMGFASLGATPIPPVRVFGLHVAFGVGVAWLLTMTLIPAYIMVAVPRKTLEAIGKEEHGEKQKASGLNVFLERLGLFSYKHWKAVLAATLLVTAISIFGVTKIRVNDNPVKWFTEKHDIRVADKVLNSHFGGTYTAYLTLSAVSPDSHNCEEKAAIISHGAEARFRAVFPEATDKFQAKLKELAQLYGNVNSADMRKCFVKLVAEAAEIDKEALSSWNLIADEVNYMEPAGLTVEKMLAAVQGVNGVKKGELESFLKSVKALGDVSGEKLLNQTLMICDAITGLSFREYVYEAEAELTAPLFKQPAMLRYLEQLQSHMLSQEKVGKTSSAVDALKKAAFELSFVAPPADAGEIENAKYDVRNEMNRKVPDTSAAIGQVFTQLEGMKKKDSLFHLVTKDYQEANLWIQLKSGDNVDMQEVVADVERFMIENPPPVDVDAGWAGLTYLNVVWQKKMVAGMFSSLASSFVVVLIMMMLLFRSPLYGVLSMIPLSVTILFIYGLIGIVGKDYDMPVAVLSALTLGLSVDFAIHFLERAREEQKKAGSWKVAAAQMFKEPAMAISRNAITISVGFTPLLVAPLVPYKTVGFFLATIMAVSWLATLFILPAILTMLKGSIFKEKK
ncbi:hypothetical protein BVX97_06475 [bacterium E08(2017)]|nr:hypothetical protein BVX97_06475 [bacterium E08(2017)]